MSKSESTVDRQPAQDPLRGYYGVPVIHASHWKWLIIWYFFFGGISGAAAVIAACARLSGRDSAAPVARAATYVSFVALLPCPPLLILDLGRPRRFLNMLRTVRARSPMSLGSWGLALFGLISSLALAFQIVLDRNERAGRPPHAAHRWTESVLAISSAISGFFVAGYTGTLLAATAVPLWSKRPSLIGPLFLASAMTSGAAAVAAARTCSDSERTGADEALEHLEAIATIAEGALLAGWLSGLGSTAKPITTGHLGSVVRHGVVGAGMTVPLVLNGAAKRLPHRWRRLTGVAATVLTLAGVFALRYAIVEGGRISADDPAATFDLTG